MDDANPPGTDLLVRNALLGLVPRDGGEALPYRVLAASPAKGWAWLFRCDHKLAIPKRFDIPTLLVMQEQGCITYPEDCWRIGAAVASGTRKPGQRSLGRWELIYPLIAEGEALFHSQTRARLISERLELLGLPPIRRQRVMRALRAFWRGGQVPSAVLTDLRRASQGRRKATARLGRRPGKVDGLPPLDHARLDRAVAEFVRLITSSTEPLERPVAYNRVIGEFYGQIPKNEVLANVPTRRVIEYRARKLVNWAEVIRRRTPRDIFGNKHAERTKGNADRGLRPGSLFQIDAVKFRVWIRNRVHPDRPFSHVVLYHVVDAFSLAIVGAWADMRPECAEGCTMAMRVAHMPKDALLARVREAGLDSEFQWDMSFRCDEYLLDRGPGVNKKELAENLGRADITMSVAPSYRAPSKYAVESVHAIIKKNLGGKVTFGSRKGRGSYSPPHSLDHVMDIDEFRALHVAAIVQHNNTTKVRQLPPGVPRLDGRHHTPETLLWYGIRHHGRPESGDTDNAPWRLLPRRDLTLTRDGLRLARTEMHYVVGDGKPVSGVHWKGKRTDVLTGLCDLDALRTVWVEHERLPPSDFGVSKNHGSTYCNLHIAEIEFDMQLHAEAKPAQELELAQVSGHFEGVKQNIRAAAKAKASRGPIRVEIAHPPAHQGPVVATPAEEAKPLSASERLRRLYSRATR